MVDQPPVFEQFTMTRSRRDFLKTSSLVSLGFAALAGRVKGVGPTGRRDLYGALVSDPDGILDLPPGFRYKIISRSGDTMADGLLRPGKPDGMAAFGAPGGKVALVCNHEISNDAAALGAFGRDYGLLKKIDRKRIYDFREGNQLHMGGTTTMIYDPAKGELVRQFLSLAGTDRNCAGGPTPWGTWVTCEEPENMTKGAGAQRHGFAFEVPVTCEPALAEPVPLKAMGRCRHEAIAVDPESGAVYLTEDRGEGLIYRFLPKTPGRLADGGKLQALAILGTDSADTRNWDESGAPKFPVGQPAPVRWVDLDDPLSPNDDMRLTAFRDKGAACFARGEGMWYGEGEVYFACTLGGATKHGQIFRYRPSAFEGTGREADQPGLLELYLESDSENLLNMCDNLTVAPWGDLIVCEDSGGRDQVRGVARDGTVYDLARNALNENEFCGACFAPDHSVLFVNIQDPGLTFAIEGPWANRTG